MKLTGLWLYPVKALAGVPLERALARASGLAIPLGQHWLADRQWIILDGRGQMVTQRALPQLALIHPKLQADGLYLHCASMASDLLLLDAKAPPDLAAVPQWQQDVFVWRSHCPVQWAPPAMNDWITQAANSPEPLYLAQMAPGRAREGRPERFGPSNVPLFADAAPYLVANDASLAALNRHLSGRGVPQVDHRRFRANLTLAGDQPWQERQWQHLDLGLDQSLTPSRLHCVDLCQRCSVITVDPDAGQFSQDTQPFVTLAQLSAMPDKPKAPAFGMNAVLHGPETWLSLGQRLTSVFA